MAEHPGLVQFADLDRSHSGTIDPPSENGVEHLKKLKQDMQAENAKLEEWVAKLVQ